MYNEDDDKQEEELFFWRCAATPLTAASLAAVRTVCKVAQDQACPEFSEHQQKRYSQPTTSKSYNTIAGWALVLMYFSCRL